MDEMRAAAARVALSLRQAGYLAYFAGGCVRDRLLGLPVKDYDIATNAPPQAVLRQFPGALPVGAHFGVVLVPAAEWRFEVATFRSESGYSDGRRPDEVQYTASPASDAARRDFTINGLMEDPETGEVLDFVGGRADLEQKLVRAIGNPAARFQEDHLRLLRAIRFAARLGLEIERATWQALCENAPAIQRIPPERIRDELTRILTEGGARHGLEMLMASGLLSLLLPEVAAMRGVAQPPEFHPEGDVWTHTLLVMEALGPCEPALAWAALLHDVGKPVTASFETRIRFHGHAEAGAQIAQTILHRLRCPNDLIARVASHVASHMKFRDVPRMKQSTFLRFVRSPHFGELLELYRADLAGSLHPLADYERLKARWQDLPLAQLRPPPLLTGNDLLAMGYRPGPQFREMLSALEEAQLEGTVQNRRQARDYVLSRWPVPPCLN